MKPSAATLACAGCGAKAPGPEVDRYPFRCAKTGRGDTDHLMTVAIDPFRVEFAVDDDPNPFIRHRQLLYSWHASRRRGMTDESYTAMVRELDAAIAGVDGRGFHTTPFDRQAALGTRLGFSSHGGLWVKDETHNVSGSHKARHLMGIMLYLRVVERAEKPPLAIASCGNAALAAAVIARAAGRPLKVFVPTDAEPPVLERLRALGAEVVICPREPGVVGDPCVLRLREALKWGALPFCCQGNENGLTIEGGQTLGYEMTTALGQTELDHVVIQVGGGALASACIQAFAFAARLGRVPRMPKFHTVQTAGVHPLKQAYDLVAARAHDGTLVDALHYAARHRSEFMKPWPEVQPSIAHGILDDETYDWHAVVRGMLNTGGVPVVVDEATLREANALARETTGIQVCHTGSAGLAGLMQLRKDGVIGADDTTAVIFSGVQR